MTPFLETGYKGEPARGVGGGGAPTMGNLAGRWDRYFAIVRGETRGVTATLTRLGLGAASLPYGWVTRLRNVAYDRGWKTSVSAGVPVVSVGNLTLGGTGKTPCVEWLVGWFREREMRVAILSRGYGADAGPNDEAMVLEENCPDAPHLQGPDRAALARVAVEELESEAIVLDDGFQHRRLRRDFDLVLVDATCPWGLGRMFPRGLLRESPRGLRRADAVLLTRCDAVSEEQLATLRGEVRRWAPNAALAECEHRPTEWIVAGEARPLDAFAGRPVAAFCGLGNPEAFRATLARLGHAPVAWRTYPDHHAYGKDDVESLRVWARETPENAVVVTTQKDWVKLRLATLGDRPLAALRIALAMRAGEAELTRRLDAKLGASR